MAWAGFKPTLQWYIVYQRLLPRPRDHPKPRCSMQSVLHVYSHVYPLEEVDIRMSNESLSVQGSKLWIIM